MGGGTKLVALLASLLAFGPLLACKQREAPAAPRNLLLITVDTLRADSVGVYGRKGNSPTPAIDGLAAAGVRFSQAWTTAPLTLPAHASILTGLTPAHHGVRLNGTHALAENVPTLAEELASEGWETGAFVAAYVLARRFGLARGFSVYDDRIPLPAYAGARLEAERAGSQVVDAAITWLRDRKGKFFLWVHLYEPHAPYEPPPPFRERFPDDPYAGEVAAADA